MDRSTVIVEDDTSRPAGAAVLTLQRGVSTWASWTFQPADAGTEITVGSLPGCDWQVAAPGVPSIELLFTGKELFAWVEQVREEIRCNDAPLPLGFTRLRHDDRLDLGPARIVVELGSDLVSRPSRPSVVPAASRERHPSSAHVAELRVRRGSSRLPAWTFSPADAGKTVSIGAADECDLQVVAAGVEANELTVLYAGDTLLVKSERADGPKLNGQHVSGEWQFLRDGDRLDLGTACIDVHVRAPGLVESGERKIEPTLTTGENMGTREARGRRTRAFTREARAKQTRPFSRRVAIDAPTPTRKLVVDPASSTRRLVMEPPQPTRPLELEVPARARDPRPPAPRQAPLRMSATLLEMSPPPPKPDALAMPVEKSPDAELLGCLFDAGPTRVDSRKYGYYAVTLVLIVGAYLGWLAMLERVWPGW